MDNNTTWRGEMAQVFDSSSGPATLSAEVPKLAQQDLCDWNGLGTSVMEVSHHDKELIQAAEETEQDFRDFLSIPLNYKVLFCYDGGRGQFASIPLDILDDKIAADCVGVGCWAVSTIKEAKRYCTPNIINVKVTVDGLRVVKPMSEWWLPGNATYLHHCLNETTDGIVIDKTPNFVSNVVVAADLSSTILSVLLDTSYYGVVYVGTQKNTGLAGLMIVTVREDSPGKAHVSCPPTPDYTVLNDNDSMFNTPPAFAWYLPDLVFK